MTVCIATFAQSDKQLILVSDSKVSFGDFSSDRAVTKSAVFLSEWSVMFAGDDITQAGPVIRRAQRECMNRNLREPDEIAEVLHEECKRERRRKIDAKVLDKHGFNTETFRSRGNKLCTDTAYYDLHSRIDKVSLSLKFLLCGFDPAGYGHIRCTDAKTPPQDYDVLGFYAIGTGANAALSSLCHSVESLHFTRDSEAEIAAYHALTAKFMAESASDVGRDTWLVSLEPGKSPKFITPLYGMDYIRKRWEKQGAPRVPKGIQPAIKDLMMTARESLTEDGIKRAVKYSPKKLRQLKGSKGIMPSVSQKSAGQQ